MFGKIVSTIISLLLLGSGIPKETIPQKPDGNWTCFQADCQHTGWMPQESLSDPTKIKLAWKTESESTSGKPIIVDDRVYLGNLRGLNCYSLKDGEIIWKMDYQGAICRQPVWYEGKIFVNS
ncbi:MAG: hypothetical protein R2883_05615 [Caldisericia bacterium]